MTNEERLADYEKSANEHWRWAMAGEQSLIASIFLLKEYKAGMLKMREGRAGKAPLGVDTLGTLIFLRAMSLENYLKALYIQKGNKVTDGKGSLAFPSNNKSGHNLKRLWILNSLILNAEVSQTLDKLTQSISSWGR